MKFAVWCRVAEIEADFIQNRLQILNLHPRRIVRATSLATGTATGDTLLLVERHAKGKWTLDDVKQLSKREIEKQADHTGRVCHANELKAGPAKKPGTHRQHQAGNTDGKEKQDWKHIVRERLECELAFVTHTKANGQHETDQKNDRGDVQHIEVKESAKAVNFKLLDGETRDEYLINLSVVRHRFE